MNWFHWRMNITAVYILNDIKANIFTVYLIKYRIVYINITQKLIFLRPVTLWLYEFNFKSLVPAISFVCNLRIEVSIQNRMIQVWSTFFTLHSSLKEVACATQSRMARWHNKISLSFHACNITKKYDNCIFFQKIS